MTTRSMKKLKTDEEALGMRYLASGLSGIDQLFEEKQDLPDITTVPQQVKNKGSLDQALAK